MSLILEALRKSEAERRAGQAIDPFATPAPAPAAAATPARRGAWLAGGGLAALALLALVVATTLRRPAPSPPAAATPAPATGGEAAPAAPVATATATRAFPPIERIAPAPAPVPTPAQDSAPAVAPPQAPASVATASPDTAAVPPAGDPVAIAPARGPGPGPAPAVRDPAPTAAAAEDTGAPLRLSELGVAQRDRLPALRVSMHMWNADPGRRFVIVDGHRQVEGDRIGSGVLRAIDADGLLLELDGRLVRVPLP